MVGGPPIPSRTPLADIVGSLSLATGLCTGQPIEHGLRRALLAVRTILIVGAAKVVEEVVAGAKTVAFS